MSQDRIPFFLAEALISLYATGADGQATGVPVWAGAYANGLRFSHMLAEVVVRASGAAYGTAHHTDEENVLSIERTWLLRKADLTDFKPVRNQQYILQLVWTAERQMFQRTFYGVTGRSLEQNSMGTNQFLTTQVFRAQWYADASGTVATPIAVAVPAPAPLAMDTVGFFRENPLLPGEYLLGFYRWPALVQLVSATVIAWAPQTAACVLTLEVGGVLTAKTLTLPVGAANVEVTAAVDLTGVVVPAGALVRWLVTSGPAAEAAAWKAAVLMVVTT